MNKIIEVEDDMVIHINAGDFGPFLAGMIAGAFVNHYVKRFRLELANELKKLFNDEEISEDWKNTVMQIDDIAHVNSGAYFDHAEDANDFYRCFIRDIIFALENWEDRPNI